MKIIILTTLILLLAMASCDDSGKRAEALYSKAEASFMQHDYNAAKLLIDSIKSSCPKAFDTRRKAISLMQRIELAEQEKSMAYLDSIRAVRLDTLNVIKEQYLYLKDPEYQDIGTFIYPAQDLKRNNGRTMLYASVDENGTMRLTSILCGHPINHHIVKITPRSGDTFASTKQSDRFYTSTHLGITTEKAEFEVGRTDGGIADFIVINRGHPLTIECQGTRTIRRTLTRTEINAITSVSRLADILRDLHAIEGQKREALNKINFIKARMSESAAATKDLDKQ